MPDAEAADRHGFHGDHGSRALPAPWPDGPGRPNRPQHADRTLRRILADIDPDRVRHTIETLVRFGTRHTLSTQTDPHRGIGAARDWIFAEFQRYAAASGGRMTVEIQSYVQPVGERVDDADPDQQHGRHAQRFDRSRTGPTSCPATTTRG